MKRRSIRAVVAADSSLMHCRMVAADSSLMHCRIIFIISIVKIGAGGGVDLSSVGVVVVTLGARVVASGLVVLISTAVTVSMSVSADAFVARSGVVVVVGFGFVSTRSLLAANASAARLDVDDESGFGATRSDVVAESVVRVKIVYPGSVVAADVPGAAGSRLPGVASLVDLGLAAGVFFLVVMVGLPMW